MDLILCQRRTAETFGHGGDAPVLFSKQRGHTECSYGKSKRRGSVLSQGFQHGVRHLSFRHIYTSSEICGQCVLICVLSLYCILFQIPPITLFGSSCRDIFNLHSLEHRFQHRFQHGFRHVFLIVCVSSPPLGTVPERFRGLSSDFTQVPT